MQDILNIAMNATAMVKGQGCQESGAKHSRVPMMVCDNNAFFAVPCDTEPNRSPTQGRYLDLQTNTHLFPKRILLEFPKNFPEFSWTWPNP